MAGDLSVGGTTVMEGVLKAGDISVSGNSILTGNLTVGAVERRDGASGTVAGNLEVVSPDDVFVDPASGDLHLKSAVPTVVDQGQTHPDVLLDIDCEPRPQGAAPDLGADEWTGP